MTAGDHERGRDGPGLRSPGGKGQGTDELPASAIAPCGALTIAQVTPTIGAMSRSVSVIITDDLDGSENAETVSFGFRGVNYEVDLGKKNLAKLEKALAAFIEAGRKAPAGGRRRPASGAGGPSADRTGDQP